MGERALTSGSQFFNAILMQISRSMFLLLKYIVNSKIFSSLESGVGVVVMLEVDTGP